MWFFKWWKRFIILVRLHIQPSIVSMCAAVVVAVMMTIWLFLAVSGGGVGFRLVSLRLRENERKKNEENVKGRGSSISSTLDIISIHPHPPLSLYLYRSDDEWMPIIGYGTRNDEGNILTSCALINDRIKEHPGRIEKEWKRKRTIHQCECGRGRIQSALSIAQEMNDFTHKAYWYSCAANVNCTHL